MANRTTYTHLSPPPVPGGGPTGFVAEYAERMKQLFDACALPLTAIGGTANAVTATLDPVLDGGGLVDGMKFTLTFGATNTAGMTLAINGGAALALLDKRGSALVAGAVVSGMRALIEYIGGSFRVLSEVLASASGGAGPYTIAITASTTWVKPGGYADDTMVRIQAWGGGGGGGSGTTVGGGGGGGYAERWVRYADVPGSVVCTVGAGGGAGGAGGNTTFGSLLTAYGGGGGGATAAGGGGGELSAGGTNNGGGGRPGGGDQNGQASGAGGDAKTIWGGAGGGQPTGGLPGGSAVFGGGAGAGRSGTSSAPGGASLFGGNGGGVSVGNPVAGSAPGGGGGAGAGGAAGARGEIRIQILG